MDWDRVEDELLRAAQRAVDGLVTAASGERLYALALYTADDGMNVALSANTEEGYAECMARYAGDDVIAEDRTYFRWALSEWKYEGWDDEEFRTINDDLFRADKCPFLEHFDTLIGSMTRCLLRLKQQETRLADVVCFITVTDSDRAEDIESRSAAAINDPAMAATFSARYD